MKNLLILFCLVFSTALMAQVSPTDSSGENAKYTIFNPKHMKKEFFITTNSGVLKTPIGLKIGFLSNPGLYVGVRHGIGRVFHSDTDQTTSDTHLFSATTGINLPMIINGNFKLVAQLGAGYGQWWQHRWERWTKSGVEFEGGLMIQKKSFLFNITGNMLTGSKTYATGDICVGVGFIMNSCK
jgi:hypothetical protein